jgi:hypothetical protein
MTNEKTAPISLSTAMLEAIRTWAADDRLWGSRSATEFNLCTFARLILKLGGPAGGALEGEKTEPLQSTGAPLDGYCGVCYHALDQCSHCDKNTGSVLTLDEASILPVAELRADIIRSAARGQGPTFIAAKLDYLIAGVRKASI